MTRTLALLLLASECSALLVPVLPLRPSSRCAAPAMVDSWYDQGARIGSPASAAPESGGKSMITQLVDGEVFDLWTELAKPFAAAAGVEYEESGPLKAMSAYEKASIDLAAFRTLLVSLNEDLPDEKTKAMFDGVDNDSDGMVEFVQCYKAINDEARARKFGEGGNFFSRLFGN
tara:strand:- start:184 stop:705 length:522 start_codon:yes stop_codon:yes gene_type:complete